MMLLFRVRTAPAQRAFWAVCAFLTLSTASARAETIRGTLNYQHPRGANGNPGPKPVISNRVEVWRWLP